MSSNKFLITELSLLTGRDVLENILFFFHFQYKTFISKCE